MTEEKLFSFEKIISQKIATIATVDDPAHDLLHFQRVVANAKRLCSSENGNLEIVLPAAWLHDFVIVPKNDPRRKIASKLSAGAAIEFLNQIDYPAEHLEAIGHAIAAHSFSAQIEPRTIEAQIVQDADRLDGLGSIGIARCFATAGLLKRPFYSIDDPFCQRRPANDTEFTIDHFFAKLFKTAQTLKTAAGRQEGLRRVETMKIFLSEFNRELTID